MNLYDIPLKTIDGEEKTMASYKGKTLIIVNVASKCGFTPQYDGLEEIYKDYKDQGLEVLAFPSNQFGEQEPGNAEEIKNFCKLNYDVTFPLFAKTDVNGEDAHPLFQYLKKELSGVFGTEKIKWNFTKFVIDKNGEPFKRYSPQAKPEKILEDIKDLL